MHDNALAARTDRLTVLARRWPWGRLLAISPVLLVFLMVGVGAQTVPTAPEVLRVAGLDIVNEQGQLLLRLGPESSGSAIRAWNGDGTLGIALYATAKGGRLEVLNAEGHEVFSAGMSPHSDVSGGWERQLRVFDQQQQEITRLQRELERINRDARDTGDVPRLASQLDQLGRELDRQRRDLESQRRDLDAQRRDLGALERQVRSLERR